MKVLSVNIGKIVNQPWRDGTPSALHKSPVKGKLALAPNGLVGDEQADGNNHGGEDKAILILPSETYSNLQIDRDYGFLGENLTTSGLSEDEVCLGDRLQIGNVLLEVSQPRSPCWKLAQQAQSLTHWRQGDFLKAYSEQGRVGFYCRVLVAGQVQANQDISWLTRNEQQGFVRIPLAKLFIAKSTPHRPESKTLLQQALKPPALSTAWAQGIGKLLHK